MATGPIKGAVALCNALSADFDVTLVVLKRTSDFPGFIDPKVRLLRLAEAGGWLIYSRILRQAGGRPRVLSLSFCFSADVVNLLMSRYAVTISSIRGHLLRVYQIEYGWLGKLLAIFHYRITSLLDQVVVMTHQMALEFESITGRTPCTIGNFVDEARLESQRKTTILKKNHQLSGFRYVFVGRLEPLKAPSLVLDAVCNMLSQGDNCSLDVFGDGPLMEQLCLRVAKQRLHNHIQFHGHVRFPWEVAATADCFVLPSLTEGVSRAAMEALYLGIPCVMRHVDSNSDLIQGGQNGILFTYDWTLSDAMKKAAFLGRQLSATRPILLGDYFREMTCVNELRKLLQNL